MKLERIKTLLTMLIEKPPNWPVWIQPPAFWKPQDEYTELVIMIKRSYILVLYGKCKINEKFNFLSPTGENLVLGFPLEDGLLTSKRFRLWALAFIRKTILDLDMIQSMWVSRDIIIILLNAWRIIFILGCCFNWFSRYIHDVYGRYFPQTPLIKYIF